MNLRMFQRRATHTHLTSIVISIRKVIAIGSASTGTVAMFNGQGLMLLVGTTFRTLDVGRLGTSDLTPQSDSQSQVAENPEGHRMAHLQDLVLPSKAFRALRARVPTHQPRPEQIHHGEKNICVGGEKSMYYVIGFELKCTNK